MIPRLIYLKDRIRSKRHDGRIQEIRDAFAEFEVALNRFWPYRIIRKIFNVRHGIK